MPSVLVVDDQPVFRRAAGSLIRSVPQLSLVGEAGSGEEAVECAARVRPDLVVMDVRLPGIDGIEATRRILLARPDTRVLLVSTYELEDLTVELKDCGATGFVRKQDLDARALLQALPPVE